MVERNRGGEKEKDDRLGQRSKSMGGGRGTDIEEWRLYSGHRCMIQASLPLETLVPRVDIEFLLDEASLRRLGCWAR